MTEEQRLLDQIYGTLKGQNMHLGNISKNTYGIPKDESTATDGG